MSHSHKATTIDTQPSPQHNELLEASATPANIYDTLLDGTDSTDAPNQVMAELMRTAPQIAQIVHSNRAFLQRSVTFLSQQGIDQFLDIGAGMLTTGSIHETVHQINPLAHVVYVDIDPMAVEQGQRYLCGNPHASILQADFRDLESILTHPDTQRLLDFQRPIGLSMLCLLHFITQDDEAYNTSQQLIARLAPESYVTLSHISTIERTVAVFDPVLKVYSRLVSPVQSRKPQEIARFFSGLTLVEPGLVWGPEWRPDGTGPMFADPANAWLFSGVACKPKG